MRELTHQLARILEMIKGFDTGYTSRVSNKMMLDYRGKRYIVTIDEIENPSKNMVIDIDRFL